MAAVGGAAGRVAVAGEPATVEAPVPVPRAPAGTVACAAAGLPGAVPCGCRAARRGGVAGFWASLHGRRSLSVDVRRRWRAGIVVTREVILEVPAVPRSSSSNVAAAGRRPRLVIVATLTLVVAAAGGVRAQRPERAPKTPAELQRQSGHVWDLAMTLRLAAVRPRKKKAYRRALDDFRAGKSDLRRDLAVSWGEFLSDTGKPFLGLALDRQSDADLPAGKAVTSSARSSTRPARW